MYVHVSLPQYHNSLYAVSKVISLSLSYTCAQDYNTSKIQVLYVLCIHVKIVLAILPN